MNQTQFHELRIELTDALYQTCGCRNDYVRTKYVVCLLQKGITDVHLSVVG